jgi:hypothetical protein
MPNRHERRKAAATSRTGKLNTTTLDQDLDDTLRRVRAEFERTGEIHSRFECVTDGEIFHVPANWPDRSAKAAACAALRDSFRRRGVTRYVFACEAWVGKTPGVAPADDPDRSESAQVIAVERNGARRYAFAEITRNGETAALGPWEVNSDVPQGWLLELLEEGHSDRAPAEPPPLGRLSGSDFQNLVDDHSEHEAEFRELVEIHDQLGEFIANQVQKDTDGNPMAIFMALESVLLSIVKNMGSPKGLGLFARFLRDHPDNFPMFPTTSDRVPTTRHVQSCKARLQHFSCENCEVGHTPSEIFGAFMNMYLRVGSQVIGALNLADRIEDWDPQHQSRLQQVGLRSSFELDDDEGQVFIALSADHYPIGVMGRRNTVGDLFVSKTVAFPQDDFATAVDKIEQSGAELILGAEAKELLCKMEKVKKGVAPRTDKSNEIWEVENWGNDEWVEQALAEIAFAKAANIQHVLEGNNLHGIVAGYRIRRAPKGLVLVSSDSDEDIFVAVRVETTKRQAFALGWLRGSEGKLPQFYQKNCWVIPSEMLHDMETLPGRERLQARSPYQEPSP